MKRKKVEFLQSAIGKVPPTKPKRDTLTYQTQIRPEISDQNLDGRNRDGEKGQEMIHRAEFRQKLSTLYKVQTTRE